MTNESAAAILDSMKLRYERAIACGVDDQRETVEALRMAVESLLAEPQAVSAATIARDLMTAGVGRDIPCDHLWLEQQGRRMGGWSLEGLTARLEKHLNGEL